MKRPTGCCARCEQTKPRDAFPMARQGTRRSYVCWSCHEEEAYRIDYRLARWQVDGVWMRRCSLCREVKVESEGYYRRGRGKRHSYCMVCHGPYKSAGRKARLARDPEARKRETEQSRAGSRRYYERHGDRARRASKRWKDDQRADSRKWAKVLEDRRLSYRLKREREGLPVRPLSHKRSKVVMVAEPRTGHRLPAKPLARVIYKRAIAAGVSPRSLCHELGVSERTVRRWRDGELEEVNLGTAERIMLKLGMDWEDIWRHEVLPELAAA